jgi:hypothetical protein
MFMLHKLFIYAATCNMLTLACIIIQSCMVIGLGGHGYREPPARAQHECMHILPTHDSFSPKFQGGSHDSRLFAFVKELGPMHGPNIHLHNPPPTGPVGLTPNQPLTCRSVNSKPPTHPNNAQLDWAGGVWGPSARTQSLSCV